MKNITFRPHFSRNTLLVMLLVASVVALVIYWKMDLLRTIYFKDQLTHFGLAINGAILVLFLVGLQRMITIFLSYSREEKAIRLFVRNLENELEPEETPLNGVSAKSIMAHRFNAMQRLFEANIPITQSALASTLLASESTRTSLPKFISNVLILTGVFGTIVSLSIALLGASDLLENAVNVSGMGLVIHGMSTALSTTITAIVCYLFFGYFYLKLTDAQTNVISAVEQVTMTYLAPRFQIDKESTLFEFTGMVRSLQALIKQMQASQETVAQAETRILDLVEKQSNRMDQTTQDMATIIQLLREGFRLHEKE